MSYFVSTEIVQNYIFYSQSSCESNPVFVVLTPPGGAVGGNANCFLIHLIVVIVPLSGQVK